MVYLSTMEEWQRQAALLFQARPATVRKSSSRYGHLSTEWLIGILVSQARITTKYHIPNLESAKYANRKRKRTTAAEDEKAGDDAPRVPRGTLEVKAYDPESGVTLKFKTEKSADVGRLIAGLGRMGRYMAALPEKTEGKGYSSQMLHFAPI